MKFVEITASEFRKFAKKSPYQSFMQTPEIAAYREQNGWTSHYVAVVDQKSPKSTASSQSQSANPPKPSILAAALLVSKPTFLGYSLFYAPGGPLLDLENTKLTTFFFHHFQAYARAHHAYALHIDPYYELIQRDRDGALVPDGFNHQKALKNLQNLGFKPIKNTSMPKYLFARDLAANSPDNQPPAENRTQNLPPDALFASFKQNTRNLTRRAERQGVTIRELTREELPILKQITRSTAARRHFTDQSLSYYQQMYDLFHPRGEIKFLLAELDGTPLSVAMFMLVGDEVVYLYSGSDEQYMKQYNAQYLIQWHMLKYATEHGFKRYNFYGIQGLPDPKSPDYGIYRFKKGFGGHVIELIGSFELPINQPIYRLHHLLAKFKSLLT